ncbi:MAG TPA: hypothetical protein VOA88_11055 [Candidatus Dormibacteraeota bacterium]|nr:hypothetical protein [Candidatus Dormibacteraeota bacterium]
MKLSWICATAVLLGAPLHAQQNSGVSSGACSPNIQANKEQVTFTCISDTPIDVDTVQKINMLLNQVVKRQKTDAENTNKKLDELIDLLTGTSHETLNELTGGDSYPVVTPGISFGKPEEVPLTLKAEGHYGLRDFELSIEEGLWTDPLTNKQVWSLPKMFLNPAGLGVFLTILHPDLKKDNFYTIRMRCTCKEGPFTESLTLRFNESVKQWQYNLWMMNGRHIGMEKPGHVEF